MDRKRGVVKDRYRWIELGDAPNGATFWFPKGRKVCTLITNNRKKSEAIYHASPRGIPYDMQKRFRIRNSVKVWVKI